MKPPGQLMLGSNLGSGKDSRDCLNRLVCWEFRGPWLRNLILGKKVATSEKPTAGYLWDFFLFLLRLLALGVKMMVWTKTGARQGVRWEPKWMHKEWFGEHNKDAGSRHTESRKDVKEETILSTLSLITTWVSEKITLWYDPRPVIMMRK